MAILQHGLSSTRDGCFLPELAAALAGVGISSFRFDFNGNGKSEGTFKYGNYSAEVRDPEIQVLQLLSCLLHESELQRRLQRHHRVQCHSCSLVCLQMEDVRAAALKLRSLGLRVAALLGHSKAGTVVILYCAKYGALPDVWHPVLHTR